MASLQQKLRKNIFKPERLQKGPLWALYGAPQKSATCIKIYDMTPRKPNSALRTVAMSLLSSKARVLIYIRGQTHNLQKHSFVLVSAGRTKDLPGLKFKAVRGWKKGDFTGLALRRNGASRYGTKTSLFRMPHLFKYRYKLF